MSPAVLSNATLGPPKFDTATMNVISATRPLPKQNAFGSTRSLSISSEFGQEIGWAIGAEEQRKYDAIFDSLGPIGGKLSGDQCKPVLLNSQLSRTLLAKVYMIWSEAISLGNRLKPLCRSRKSASCWLLLAVYALKIPIFERKKESCSKLLKFTLEAPTLKNSIFN